MSTENVDTPRKDRHRRDTVGGSYDDQFLPMGAECPFPSGECVDCQTRIRMTEIKSPLHGTAYQRIQIKPDSQGAIRTLEFDVCQWCHALLLPDQTSRDGHAKWHATLRSDTVWASIL